MLARACLKGLHSGIERPRVKLSITGEEPFYLQSGGGAR
jgi:hypothetical protein